MGVKDLWNILAPISHKKSLYDLQGTTVAVDLSCWVCEGQVVGEKTATTQTRMYLRNVFFKTCTLLMLNITPIFVLDGEAPEVKHDAMKQRNDARFKKYRSRGDDEEHPKKSQEFKKGSRSRFKGILKQCKSLLELMSVCCVQSEGEAEALCAQLQREGIVDAVITQDSDVFLYGARMVYRNLTIKLGTGTVDTYCMNDIEEKLRLDRYKLVAMSVLCGCDYDAAGVHGVGKELAYKYLSGYEGDVLTRLRTLKSDKTLQRLEDEKNGCSKCGHLGKPSEHRRDGCQLCGLVKGCEENTSPLSYKNLEEEEKKKVTLELFLRRKAIQEQNFPNEDAINEFMNSYQSIRVARKEWRKPDIPRFVSYCVRMLEWEPEYAFEKILPLFTRWVLKYSDCLMMEELIPKKILKKRVLKGVASYDVGWEMNDENVRSCLSNSSEDCLKDGLCVSTEPQVLISGKLPAMLEEFNEMNAKKKPVKAKKEKKTKKTAETDTLTEALEGLSLSKPKKVRQKKVKCTEKPEKSPDVLHEDYLENSILFSLSSETKDCEVESVTSFSGVFSRELSPLKPLGVLEESLLSNLSLDLKREEPPSFLLSTCSPLATVSADNASAHGPSKFVPNFDISFDLSNVSSGASYLVGVDVVSKDGIDVIDLSSCDDTVEYDLSAIVDDIVSRKRFY